MALQGIAVDRAELLASELRRIRPRTDEIEILLELAATLSELTIAVAAIGTAGDRCHAVGRQLSERADRIAEAIEANATLVDLKRGDTLYSLAKAHGTTVAAIVEANDSISDPSKIRAGETILIPTGGSATGPVTAASPTVPESPDAAGSGGRIESPGDGSAPKVGLTEEDFVAVADRLGVDVNAIKAVAEVEAAGDGFLASGRPKILFEGAKFAAYTDGEFSGSHPHLSHSYGESANYYIGGEGEHDRLNEAISLDSEAAKLSTSWGRFQIMGFNYELAGYATVDEYVTAMEASEANHLDAFASFIESNPAMHTALAAHDWPQFALSYNGPSYADNQYDIKIAEAYGRLEAGG